MNVLVDYDKFKELLGTDNYDTARQDHEGWVAELLSKGSGQDSKWTESIAVGSKDFIDKVKVKLGVWIRDRDTRGTDSDYQLREPANSYMHLFEAEKDDIGSENTYFWNINI